MVSRIIMSSLLEWRCWLGNLPKFITNAHSHYLTMLALWRCRRGFRQVPVDMQMTAAKCTNLKLIMHLQVIVQCITSKTVGFITLSLQFSLKRPIYFVRFNACYLSATRISSQKFIRLALIDRIPTFPSTYSPRPRALISE